MAINVNVANAQAGQLSGYANQLVSAKNQLSSYKSSISTYWQGQEVSYIVRGIDQTIAQIDSVIKQLNSLSSDIKSTAATIKREDDAAAAAARAARAKQQRIQTAQTNYNRAVNECDDLYKQRDELQKTLSKSMSASKRANYMKQWDKLMAKYKLSESDIEKIQSKKVVTEFTEITCTKMTNPWISELCVVIAEYKKGVV